MASPRSGWNEYKLATEYHPHHCQIRQITPPILKACLWDGLSRRGRSSQIMCAEEAVTQPAREVLLPLDPPRHWTNLGCFLSCYLSLLIESNLDSGVMLSFRLFIPINSGMKPLLCKKIILFEIPYILT